MQAAGDPEMSPAQIAAAIRNRGLQVGAQGTYIGMFEFCVWCAMRRRPLDLIIGQHRISVAEYHPMLQSLMGCLPGEDEERPLATVAACCWSDSMQDWRAIHDEYAEAVSHYVLAMPFSTIVGFVQ